MPKKKNKVNNFQQLLLRNEKEKVTKGRCCLLLKKSTGESDAASVQSTVTVTVGRTDRETVAVLMRVVGLLLTC